MDEIKVTIVTCISNLGKTADAGNEVDTAFPKLKSSGLTVAPVVIITSVVIGSILPPRVVAELELDSVIPPPDTVKEDSKNLIPLASVVHAKVNSKREISEEPPGELRKGTVEFSREIDDQPLHDVDSKVPGLNLLVNDRKRLVTLLKSDRRFTSLLEWSLS